MANFIGHKIFIKTQFVFVLTFANMLVCITTLLLLGYLHIKSPLLKWTEEKILLIIITIFFICYYFFILWLLKTRYPNKLISQSLEGIIITLVVLGCVAILFILVQSLIYGTFKSEYDNEIARDVTYLFRLFSIALFIISVFSLFLIIISVKLKTFISKEYTKSIVHTISTIGSNET